MLLSNLQRFRIEKFELVSMRACGGKKVVSRGFDDLVRASNGSWSLGGKVMELSVKQQSMEQSTWP